MKKKILILFGGKSCEHDISIISTFQCLKFFDEYLYEVFLVYIDKSGVWRYVDRYNDLEKFLISRGNLKKVQLGVNENILYVNSRKKYKPLTNIDVVVPIMHGINGEDGCIAGLLNMSKFPFVGSDNISSSIGIDKSLFKKVCDNVLPSIVLNFQNLLNEENLIKDVQKNIGFPCIIKPSRLGSSIGIEICKNKENLIDNVKKSLIFDKKVIIEPFITEFREFNIALYKMGGEFIVSEIEEPNLKQDILSFNDKYLNFTDQYTLKDIPAKVNNLLKNKIIDNAKKCYNLLNCSGVVRVDFIYDKSTKKLYINEINTIPGAMGLYLFEAKGINRKDVINQLIDEALRKFYGDNEVEENFTSGVLEKQDFSKFKNL